MYGPAIARAIVQWPALYADAPWDHKVALRIAERFCHITGNVLGQLQMHRTRPFLLRDAECVTHQSRMLAALTIWRDNLVSGRIEAMTSTIWNRACLLVLIGF